MTRNPTTNLSDTREFAEQTAGRAVQAGTFGVNWMREVAEQSLHQNKVALEGYLTISRNAIDSINRQTSDLGKRSMSLAEETLSNAFDFAHKLVHVKDPQEVAQLHGDFISRQAHVLADEASEVGKTMMRSANEVAETAVRSAAESSRRRSEPA
jgi:hypothetical protein